MATLICTLHPHPVQSFVAVLSVSPWSIVSLSLSVSLKPPYLLFIV